MATPRCFAPFACDGLWTDEKLLARGADVSPVCARCGAAEDGILHRCWTCPALPGPDEADWIKATDHLQPRAEEGARNQPTLWLRGLPERDIMIGP